MAQLAGSKVHSNVMRMNTNLSLQDMISLLNRNWLKTLPAGSNLPTALNIQNCGWTNNRFLLLFYIIIGQM